MPQRPQQWQELLAVGPFGGIDATTDPFFISQVCLADCQNLIPNAHYGGYLTVPGRIEVFNDQLPSVPTGMGVLQQAGQPDVYLFAATDPTTNIGHLYAGTLQTGILTRLTAPDLQPNQLTYFVPSKKWVFVSNGVDTPLKIDTALNVTQWGIVAPSDAPKGNTTGVGPLSGTYYYCETFSNGNQESSQGVISDPIVAAGATATGTLTLSNELLPDNIITVVIDNIVLSYTYPTPTNLVNLLSTAQVAVQLAGQINANANMASLVGARAVGNTIVLTSNTPGSPGNDIVYYATTNRAQSTPALVTPVVPTAFTGGTDGNSITVKFASQTTDPQVTHRNLYRIGGASGAWTLVSTKPLAQTEFLDTISDADLTGQYLVVFRDPPPAFKSIALYQDRIFGFGPGALVQWSNYNEPWGFNPNLNTLQAGPNDLGDQAVTCADIGSMLVLLKDRSTKAVIGNSDNTFSVISLFPVGCTSAQSAAVLENYLIWDSIRGIQLFDGNQRVTISDGQFMQSNIKSLLDAYAPIDRTQSIGFAFDRMMAMSFPTQNQTFLFDLRSMSWFPLKMALGCVYYDPESLIPVLGASFEDPGSINQWFSSTTNGDLGNPVEALIESRITDAGSINTDKSFGFAFVQAPVQQAKVVVTPIINPGPGEIAQPYDVDLFASGQVRHRIELPVGLEGSEMQLRLTSSSLQQVVIHKIALYGKMVRANKPNSLRDG